MGWGVGNAPHPAAPRNVETGGPSGDLDRYLELTALGGDGPGSRLAVLNRSQWAGDYMAEGINAIRMDVNNFGPDDLFLRLVFEDFDGPGPPVNLALSTEAIFVAAGSGWTSILFRIAPEDLLAPFGTAAGALRNAETVRIFHNPAPEFPGPGAGPAPVNVRLGVDNIEAAAIPEPGSWLLLSGGLATIAGLRFRRS